MKASWILSAAVAMGVSSLAPGVVRADPWQHQSTRYDRFDTRHDFDENVEMKEVPKEVRETINRERHDRRIESIQYVHREGKLFYRFRIDDPHPRDKDMSIRVAPDGRLLSVEEAQKWDDKYRK
jgi:hypothetical protein